VFQNIRLGASFTESTSCANGFKSLNWAHGLFRKLSTDAHTPHEQAHPLNWDSHDCGVIGRGLLQLALGTWSLCARLGFSVHWPHF